MLPPRGRVVRSWGRTVLSVVGGLAALALLSAPASVVVQPVTARPVGKVASRSESARTRVEPSPAPAAAEAAPAPDETVIAPPPETFDAPPPAPEPPPAALTAATVGRSAGTWAVVIGIDDYPGSRSDLRASVADANELDAALAGYGIPADRRLVLRDTQATAATITDSLRWLVARASSDATVVFFYAGHVRKLGGSTEAIVGADGRLVTDAAMASLLRPLLAQRVWIAMASCYGGGFTELLAPGRILTGAAGANSLAYENSTFHRSYLVEYMVHRAMNERQAPGSVEQSFAWASAALHRDYPNRMPVEFDQLDGDLQLGSSAAPPAAPPAPPPSGGAAGGAGGGGGGAPPPAPGPSSPPPDDHCLVTFGSLVQCDGDG